MTITKFKQHIELLTFYTQAKLKAESYRHFAGYLWWLLDPLFGAGIYYFLFKVVMNRGEDNFIAFLLLGLTVWKWINDSILKSAGSILANLNLLKKIKLNAHIFPVTDIYQNTWKFMFVFGFMLISYGVYFNNVSYYHLLLIPVLISTLIFILGCSLLLSSLIPFLPDLQFLVGYGMRLLFYASAVLFSENRVPEKYKLILTLNPIAGLIKSYRQIIIYQEPPGFIALIYPVIFGVVLGIIGLYIISKKNQEYPKLH